MPRPRARPASPEVHEEYVDAFRYLGPDFARVAKRVGGTKHLARVVWERGWPEQALPPAKEALAREEADREAAAAEREAHVRLVEEARERQKEQVAESFRQEGQMVLLSKAAALHGLAGAGALAIGAKNLANQVRAQLEKLAALPDTDPRKLSPTESLVILGRVAQIQRSMLTMARESMEMERLHLGKPTEILGVHTTTEEDIPLEEAEARVAAAQAAVARARRLQSPQLRVVEAEGVAVPPDEPRSA